MAFESTKDHWAFLEEIEAPMWVDLTLEAKSTDQFMNDEWFHTSHLFHQCSSRHLKATFAHSGDRSISSDFNIEGFPSPKLPSSVSRSRGKDYSSKKGRGEDLHLFTKQHPVNVLNGKSLCVNSRPIEGLRHKLSFVNTKGRSRSDLNLVSERVVSRNAKDSDLKAASSHRGSENSSNSITEKASESNSSTITSDGQQSQKRNLEVSSHAPGHSSGLLSAMRISLRKSCITRQASRVEVSDDKRQSGDNKSSSRKSSVESSSRPCYDVKNSTVAFMQNKKQTTEIRKVTRMTREAKSKEKDLNISKPSNVQFKIENNFRRGRTCNIAQLAHQEATKSMQVQNQTLHAKVLMPNRVNGSKLVSTEKDKQMVRIAGFHKTIGDGKENGTGRISVSQNCSSRNTVTGKAVNQKGTKQNVLRKLDGAEFISAKGNISSPSKMKQLKNGTRKVYFR